MSDAQWWRQQIGVGIERCPVIPETTHSIRQPRTRREFAASARANHALRLHGQGMTYAAIGREFGVTRERARQLVRHALKMDWP